ncbi:MAG TPA: zinc dependent phospholipase C family protein [Lachnospiraceae bacterium]|nr:zinc dependent phospholipase C family protein [Lachnospiraceae bacterium]
MLKKSHIYVGRQLAENNGVSKGRLGRYALMVGSIVPDVVPTFLSKPHRIDTTFDIVERKVARLVNELEQGANWSLRMIKDLGVILHYVTDYFTYPHNDCYEGTVLEHLQYELRLHQLIQQVMEKNECYELENVRISRNLNTEVILNYIIWNHETYLQEKSSMLNDCLYIQKVCKSLCHIFFGNSQIAVGQDELITVTI